MSLRQINYHFFLCSDFYNRKDKMPKITLLAVLYIFIINAISLGQTTVSFELTNAPLNTNKKVGIRGSVPPLDWSKSIILDKKEFFRFYNPRLDSWREHFKLNNYTIEPLTNIGQVTAKILGFNDRPRLLERQLLIDKKKYPSPPAIRRMNT